VPPLQQPFGQVFELHEQVPLVVSQRLFAQAPQAAPPVPHSEPDCDAYATHVFPLQQPFGQEFASQTHDPLFALHSWPDGHAEHAAPAVPHEPFVSEAYGTHVEPLQQPFGQEVASQMHCPPLLHV
jgi:hypothetical protein